MVNKLKTSISFLLAGTTFLMGGARLFCQVFTADEARSVSNVAVKLAKGNDLPSAVKILTESLSRCGDTPAAGNARGLLNFTLGYVSEMSQREPQDHQLLNLNDSIKYYAASLRDLPGNKQAVTNLVLVLKRLGRSADAIPYLESAAASDPENADFYYREQGDIYRSSRDPAKALACYARAARMFPGSDISYWRMIAVLREFETAEVKTMLDCSSWLEREGKPEFARRGYELVMERARELGQAGNDLRNVMDRAILLWVNLGATNNWLSQESLESIGAARSWPAEVYQGLLSILGAGSGSGSVSWWTASRFGRHVAANVSRMMGARYLTDGKPDLAVRSYIVALEDIGPQIREYGTPELVNQPVLPLLISVDLARLFYLYPGLDPGGRGFQQLERRWFNDKSQSYAINDLLAIQYEHTILGLIYAERKKWTSSWRPENAIFQLEHALDTAEQRAARNPSSAEPMPHLEKLLVEGYLSTENIAGALRSSVRAAMGYLDLDGLREAEEMLRILEKTSNAPQEESPKVVLLRTMLQGRRAIHMMAERNFDKSSPDYWRKKNELAWVSSTDLAGLDRGFFFRQKAKVLADMGTAAIKFGNSLEAMRDYSEALKALKQTPVLTSAYDVVRLEAAKNTITQILGIKETRDEVVTGYSIDQTAEFKGWTTWSLPARYMSSTHQVAINPDIYLASEISNYLANQPNYKPGDLQFTIFQGAVTVAPMVTDPDLLLKTVDFLKNRSDVKKVNEGVIKDEAKVRIRD